MVNRFKVIHGTDWEDLENNVNTFIQTGSPVKTLTGVVQGNYLNSEPIAFVTYTTLT